MNSGQIGQRPGRTIRVQTTTFERRSFASRDTERREQGGRSKEQENRWRIAGFGFLLLAPSALILRNQ
jgi:hypothetical protein